MAHLAGDELPPSFDVVVQGTGVVESILAAAFSRVGKSVLHLDRNAYYGMAWASFMQREMLEWLEEFCSSESSMPSADVMKNAKHMIVLDTSPSRFTNIVQMPSITEDHSTSPLKSLGSKARRLVYDLLPKLLACRGQMVDLLTQSGCSRYLEFKAVSRICIYQSGQVEQVPCSRADVFESKLVSMVEKRKMMKFLSFCAEYKGDSNEDAIDNISFGEYMKKHGLTENLACYVALCIAMTREDVPAEEGLLAAKLFLQSLGRFDNAPFLYPIFGCGELPQAFCRFCAVYGGVYCLKRHVTAIQICTNEDGDSTQLTSVTCSNGQAISCSDMSWALVKWIEEDRVSVIPSAWVTEPHPLPNAGFPVKGKSFWRKKTNIFETFLLNTSDVKAELETASNPTSKLPTSGKRILENAESTMTKKHKEDKKARKEASIAAANEMAIDILKFHSCMNCQEREQQLAMQTEEKENLKASLEAKKAVIANLEEKVCQLQGNKLAAESSHELPYASTSNKEFLRALILHYDSYGSQEASSATDDDQTTFSIEQSSSDRHENTSGDELLNIEERRKRNIEENNSILLQLGLQPISTDSRSQKVTRKPTEKNQWDKATAALLDKSINGLIPTRRMVASSYHYEVTPSDLHLEQQAFEAGEGKRELVEGFGVYIKYVALEQAEQTCKNSATGLMRTLIGVWYNRQRLAACSVTSGINSTIRTAVFKYCDIKLPGVSCDKLMRDLTSKCGEERRKLLKVLVCPASDVMTTFNIEPQLRLSRGIVVTDGPIRNMHDQLVLLTLPAGSIGPHQVTDIRLLQLPASTNTAVDGTYMFHLTCINQEDSTAEQELSGVTELFFTTTQQSSNDIEQQQPLLLWTLYFNMELCHVDQDNCHEHAPQLPTNMYLTSDPDGTMTYENAMQEAKKIFKRVCPNDEFLPPTESEYTPATE